MKKLVMAGVLVVFITIAAMAGLGYAPALINSYNSLTTYTEQVNSQWGQVENVYQRRNDLIPNVVNAVGGYAKHEKSTLQGVIEARAKATQITVNAGDLTPEKLAALESAQGELSSALSRLMAVVENYPDLKASELFKGLMTELEGSENRISVERKKFNEIAKEYNTYRNKFPTNAAAFVFSFKPVPYFKAEEAAKQAPRVEFN